MSVLWLALSHGSLRIADPDLPDRGVVLDVEHPHQTVPRRMTIRPHEGGWIVTSDPPVATFARRETCREAIEDLMGWLAEEVDLWR